MKKNKTKDPVKDVIKEAVAKAIKTKKPVKILGGKVEIIPIK